MQAHGPACKLMDLHASLCNSMQAYVMGTIVYDELELILYVRLTVSQGLTLSTASLELNTKHSLQVRSCKYCFFYF